MLILVIYLIPYVMGFDIASGSSDMLYFCDYKEPYSSIEVMPSGIPCAALYRPAMDQLGLNKTVKITAILHIDKLVRADAFLCYKLELVSRCRQRWFVANEITRFTITKSVLKSECLAESACEGCEIANNYPRESCRGFSFSEEDVSKTIVFRSPAVVYRDLVGNYHYSGLVSRDGVIDVGGGYESKIFVVTLDESDNSKDYDAVINPENQQIMIPSEGLLLNYSGTDVYYKGRHWMLYDKNHYVARENRTDPIIVKGASAYSDVFYHAQLNVTEWKFNYLECSLKNVIIELNRKNITTRFGKGEVFDGNYLHQYPCYSIRSGELLAQNGCLVWSHMLKVTPLSGADGEVGGLKAACIRAIRVNSTHVVRITDSNSVEVFLHSFSNLRENEMILESPPKTIDSLSDIMNIFKNNGVLLNNTPTRPAGPAETITTPEKSITSILFWVSYLALWTIVIIFVVLVALRSFRGNQPVKPAESVHTVEINI
jgi:hypothetical protein